MKREGNMYRLASNRTFYAYDGIVSVHPGGHLTEGYDSRVSEFHDEPLTFEERREIADEMIARWSKWACGEKP